MNGISALWNFETIRVSPMMSKWLKLAENLQTLHFKFFGVFFASKG